MLLFLLLFFWRRGVKEDLGRRRINGGQAYQWLCTDCDDCMLPPDSWMVCLWRRTLDVLTGKSACAYLLLVSFPEIYVWALWEIGCWPWLGFLCSYLLFHYLFYCFRCQGKASHHSDVCPPIQYSGWDNSLGGGCGDALLLHCYKGYIKVYKNPRLIPGVDHQKM